MANAFLEGLIAGRLNKQNRLDEQRKRSAEQRTQTEFEQSQQGLRDLSAEFGNKAYAADEFQTLQGTVDDRDGSALDRQRMQGTIADEDTERKTVATANGLRLFDGVVNKAIQEGTDPTEALQNTINNMQPQARALFGFDDHRTVSGLLEQVQSNPQFFKEQYEALVPQKAAAGSTASPKSFEGDVTLSDGSTQRAAVVRNNDGSLEVVGGLPSGVSVTNFTPDGFAPQRAGSTVFQGTGGTPGITVVGDVSRGLEEGARAEERGTQVGRTEGQTISEDMELSQTASNQIGRMVSERRAGLDRVTQVIDDAIEQTDWDTAGLVQDLKRIDGSTPANLAATLSTVQANATLDKLMEIKAAGATLGQITERELDLLQNAVTALNQEQSPAQLRENLLRYKGQLARTVSAIEQDYQADIERGRLRTPTNTTNLPDAQRATTGSGKTMSAADFLGGN